MTDIATGWTECAALLNRSQMSVVDALDTVRRRLPFALKGIDSDNGAAFINNHLQRYCETNALTFTRCRAYHKNDQAHIEQKNWSVVRQTIGYDRYEGPEATAALTALYGLLHLYANGYLPPMKLVGKERIGARIHKRYDRPQTPFERARHAGVLTDPAAAAFEQALAQQGPLTLRRQIDHTRARLWELRVRSRPTVSASA